MTSFAKEVIKAYLISNRSSKTSDEVVVCESLFDKPLA